MRECMHMHTYTKAHPCTPMHTNTHTHLDAPLLLTVVLKQAEQDARCLNAHLLFKLVQVVLITNQWEDSVWRGKAGAGRIVIVAVLSQVPRVDYRLQLVVYRWQVAGTSGWLGNWWSTGGR